MISARMFCALAVMTAFCIVYLLVAPIATFLLVVFLLWRVVEWGLARLDAAGRSRDERQRR